LLYISFGRFFQRDFVTKGPTKIVDGYILYPFSAVDLYQQELKIVKKKI